MKTYYIWRTNSVKDNESIVLDKNLKATNNCSEKEEDAFNERNKKYNTLIEKYTNSFEERSEFKNNYKRKFFWFIMPLYMLVICASLFILIASVFISNIGLGLILGAVGTLLTTIISLPTIIANYLFPKNEDSNLVSMFQLLFDFDSKYYDHVEEAKNKVSKEVNKKQ